MDPSRSGRDSQGKNLRPCRELNPGLPAHSLIAILTEKSSAYLNASDLNWGFWEGKQ
jgi:hypothetical protein